MTEYGLYVTYGLATAAVAVGSAGGRETLAFGWSTAIVTVVIRLIRYRRRAQVRPERHDDR